MSFSGSELAFIVIVGIVLFLSVVCNILVVVVIVVTPKMRNPTNVLICNLAVSDLLLASLVLPQNLHDVSHSDENYYEGDFLCRVVYTCPLLCIMGSIYSMVAISFERTQAIVLNADKRLTLRTAFLEMVTIWFLSCLFSIPTVYEHSEYVVRETANGTVLGCGSNGVSYSFTITNGVGLLLVSYVIPLTMLLFNYGRILAFFRSKGMFGRQAAERGVVFQALFKTRMTVVKMLILVAVLFAISWAPYFALLIREKVTGIADTEYSDGAGNMLKIALSAFSTAYNFAVYFVYNRNFRLGVVRLVGYKGHARCCAGKITPSGDTDFVVTHIARPSPSE